MRKIRVLIVDDSMLIRTMLSELLARQPDIEVIGTAEDPYDAREKIKRLNPDVLTLDVEMPKMDGVTFLEKIMTLRPMPVIMVSTLTERGAEITLRALEIGAVDFITKPVITDEAALLQAADALAVKIRAASHAKAAVSGHRIASQEKTQTLPFHGKAQGKIIAIGASTGGVEALRDILQPLPDTLPPIVITQHMPPGFTTSFAKRLDKVCAPRVQEARDGQPLKVGNIYVAPGDYHMEIARPQSGWCIRISDGENVSGHKPSVDRLFLSVAKHAGNHAVGVILTGMGRDGAQGLLAMRQAGAATLGQNEESCVVYGMPRVAMQMGAVEREVSLARMPQAILDACSQEVTGATSAIRGAL